MNEKEFNLLEEPWLRVIDDKCETKEVSLIELFRDAHLYKDLCGELPTQDFAVMRLLLAVLHTVFSRYDPDGKESPLNDPEDARKRWKALWENEKFPSKVIADYLESQKESFYLFHPERPFYQCEKAKIGTEYSSAKLNGNLSESSNKIRLFPNVSGKAKNELSFSEAARWLIYVNAYDDTSAKPSIEAKKLSEKLPSPGAGWLGRLGLIAVLGNNLFETLMLNFIVHTENGELFKKEKPIWEREKIPDGERVQIILPDNLSALYTLQSRRLYLKREKQTVTGYYLLGGDFFEKENAFLEPMTIWTKKDSKTSEIYTPRRHNASKQMWREFSAMIHGSDKMHRPGIISWIDTLKGKELIEDRLLNIKIASVQYGDKDFFVNNVFSDSLQMHASLLSEMNGEWPKAVENSVKFCDSIANKVGKLAQRINLAAGGDYVPKDSSCSAAVFADRAKAEFYDRLDLPFREWLCALDPETDDSEDRETEWQKQCLRIARKLGSELIGTVRTEAIFGRRIKKEGEKSKIYSAAKAENQFLYELEKVQNK